jgi:hypothetical protein
MSSAVDVDVLVYASHVCPEQEAALEVLESTAELLYLFWPVAMGYLRVATDARIARDPLSPAEASANLDGILARPNVRSPGEADGFWEVYRSVAADRHARPRLPALRRDPRPRPV